MEKKSDIQNPIIGNLMSSQVNANKRSHAKVKQLLGQAKGEELQPRLDRLRKRIDQSNDDDNNNNNINFDDGIDDDADDDNIGGDELHCKLSNLIRPIIPSNDNKEELFHRYKNLKVRRNNDEELLRRYNDLWTLLFRGILLSPPLPLKRRDIEKDYDDTFLLPQNPPDEALKTDFDHPITNLIGKANNITEIVPKNEKQDLEKYDLQ